MRKITQFSVDYPITIFMLVLAVLLLGFFSFRKLGMDLFPDLNNPRIFIELKAGERPPEEIEKQLVESIESLAIRQKKVTQVSSITRVGSAQIIVEYGWNADMDEAFLNLQKTLATFSQNADIDELTITQHDPNAAPVMLLGLSHPQITDMDELRRIAENYLRNELIRLEGIAEVELLGQEEKEVVIETNNYLLEAYNLTPASVANRIRSYNRNASGGSIVEMGRKYIIKGVGEFQSLDDIGRVIVSYAQQQGAGSTAQTSSADRVPVYLKDVANIYFKNKDPKNIVHINRQRCMALAIYKETKFNTVQAVNDLLKALTTLRKALPGYELTIIQNQGEFITSAVNEVKQTALIGILLAVAVIYIFLRRVGLTTIVSVAIPISIIATFNLMYFKGLTLNIMTLGGLALGAGMLVDNAIVVIENIIRHLEAGDSLKQAAIEGTAQVSAAITSSTITTIVVFLPIVYLHGSAGELFKDQAWTVTFSLLASLVVAMMVIPMFATRFLKPAAGLYQQRSLQIAGYQKWLAKILQRRGRVILVAIGIVALSIALIPIVGSEFVPKTDIKEFSIELKLPEGTSLQRTEKTVESIERIIQELLGADLKAIYSKIGPTATLSSSESSLFEDENTATIKVILNANHRLPSDRVIASLGTALKEIPDLQIQFIQEQTALQSILGTDAAPIVVEIKGEDLTEIQNLTQQVRQQLASLNDLFNLETSFDEGRPEIEVVLDRVKAGLHNISINDISSQLQAQLQGSNAGQWDNKGELQDLTIKLPRMSIKELESIIITNGQVRIPLHDLASIRLSFSPKEIERRNQSRIGKVTAHLNSKKPFDRIVREIENRVRQINFPPDYQFQITGEEQKRQEAFSNLRFALLLSIILVYMVLASQFESLLHPFTILLTIPLAGSGAILIFFILGKTLNIMAYIGIIMLGGIAVNNSILLVDAINQLRREGRPKHEAILEAGQRRIRPILITSLTTILGLLPLTVGFGEGVALRSPMALAVIGGLSTSMLVSLVVIPCVYSVLDQLRGKQYR